MEKISLKEINSKFHKRKIELIKKYLGKTLTEKSADGFFFFVEKYGTFQYFLFDDEMQYEIHDDLGQWYHIVLIKEDCDGKRIHQSNFEGILMNPREYILPLMEKGYYGLVCKKTNKSLDYINQFIHNNFV